MFNNKTVRIMSGWFDWFLFWKYFIKDNKSQKEAPLMEDEHKHGKYEEAYIDGYADAQEEMADDDSFDEYDDDEYDDDFEEDEEDADDLDDDDDLDFDEDEDLSSGEEDDGSYTDYDEDDEDEWLFNVP